MNAQKPDRHELQANGKHPAPCAKFCEATAFTIELRRAQAEIKVQTRAADHWMAEANKSHNLTVTQQAENAQWRVDFKEMVIARDAALARLAEIEKRNQLNQSARSTVDDLLAQAGYAEDSSARNLLGCMNFDAAGASPVQPSQALVVEPVYQYQLANGNWIDQTKESYDYNVKHGQATVRMLYATPQAAPQPKDMK